MLNFLKNIHVHNYGDVSENGFQYCRVCNKAIYVGEPECKHKYRIQNIVSDKGIFKSEDKIIYVQECMNCGKLNKFEI